MNSLSDFSMDYFSLHGKVAMVTGGNKGIGQAISVALAKAGADLCIVVHSEKDLDETRKLIEKERRRVEFIQADLEEKTDVIKVIEESKKLFGKIDILVNNAGTIKRNSLFEYTDEDWQFVLDVNLNSVYYLSKEIAKTMVKNRHGKIINIASMLSFQGGKYVPAYTASKHAVAGLTKSFANELAEFGVNVNAIAPGYIKTANTEELTLNASRNSEILSRIPAGRWGEPFDLMGAVIFLASRASDYMDGHILAVDGGWLAR